jgi:hypothetical protein
MTVALPKKVKVAGYDFGIVDWQPMKAEAADRYGECSAQELVIRIRTDKHISHTTNTFLHEITHAIYWAYGIRDEDKEERIVEMIGNGWAQVFRDNPDVLRFLSESLHTGA